MSQIWIKCDSCNNDVLKHECYLGSHNFCNRKCYANFQRLHPGNAAGKHWIIPEEKRVNMRGSTAWNKGKKHTAETLRKMRNSQLKRIKDGGYVGKPPVMRGADHPRWTGNSTEDYRERRRFRIVMQSKIFYRDNYTCQICDQYGGSIQVDHIKSWAKYPELRFDADNCRTLCMACHYYITFKRKLPQGVVWGHNLGRRKLES